MTTSKTTNEFEREKWLAECEFRRQELHIRTREQDRLQSELELKTAEARRSRWSSPLVLAVIGAGLAALGNAGVSWMNDRDQRQLEDARALSAQRMQDESNKSQLALERFKAESSRLLEVIKTNDPDKAAVNMKFLLDAGLIENQQTARYLTSYLATRSRGQGPALPSGTSFGFASNCQDSTGKNKTVNDMTDANLHFESCVTKTNDMYAYHYIAKNIDQQNAVHIKVDQIGLNGWIPPDDSFSQTRISFQPPVLINIELQFGESGKETSLAALVPKSSDVSQPTEK